MLQKSDSSIRVVVARRFGQSNLFSMMLKAHIKPSDRSALWSVYPSAPA